MAPHTYGIEKSYTVTLTVVNTAGTSTSQTFTGKTASNNGGSSAIFSQVIDIPPSSPIDVRGFQKECRFPTQTDLINVIKWSAPTTGNMPVAYRIYRDAALTDLIATISASSELEFKDHNRKKNKMYTYYIVSVSALDTISPSVSIIIPKVECS